MSSSEPQTFVERTSDEISVKVFILRTRAYAYFVARSWYLILLAALPLAFKNYIQISKIQPTYNAKTVLLLKTNEPLKDNAIISEIFTKLANSRSVIAKVILSNTEIDGEEDLLINHYINIYEETYPELFGTYVNKGFRFTKTDPANFDQEELNVFDFVLTKLITKLDDFSDGFITTFNDKKLGFIHFNISTPSEELSIKFNEVLYSVLNQLYYQNVMFAQDGGINNMVKKADSIKINLDKKFSYLLRKRDQYELLFKAKDTLANLSRRSRQIQKLELEVSLLKEDYLDYSEKIKEAEWEANNKTPLILVTEKSMRPITPYQPSAKLAAIKGAIYGSILIIILLIGWKMYRDIVAEISG